jgi:hypothetical protein
VSTDGRSSLLGEGKSSTSNYKVDARAAPASVTGCHALKLTAFPLYHRHLPKNFDNIHNLEFKKDAQGNPTKVAIGMYSGEGEYVPFAADCVCDGPVEVRLPLRVTLSCARCPGHLEPAE